MTKSDVAADAAMAKALAITPKAEIPASRMYLRIDC
jgi:hypothetical protein